LSSQATKSSLVNCASWHLERSVSITEITRTKWMSNGSLMGVVMRASHRHCAAMCPLQQVGLRLDIVHQGKASDCGLNDTPRDETGFPKTGRVCPEDSLDDVDVVRKHGSGEAKANLASQPAD